MDNGLQTRNPRPSALSAIFQQRCPRCRRGRIFRTSSIMNETCPECGLRFEREPGYFIGAMYFSYGLAVTFLVPVFFLGRFLFPDWSSMLVAGVAVVAFLPFVALTFRYSRTLWIYYDRWLWPE
jgi:uncharacterized protein (DUF983 family)